MATTVCFADCGGWLMTNATVTNGRFQAGNQAAVGHSSKSQRLRAAMLQAISEDDVQDIVKKLVTMAKGGDIDATKILFGFIGKPVEGPAAPVDARALATHILARIRADRALSEEPERRPDD